ncbi:MAG TPA: hypothetical protein VFR08_04450, partial [Candidatus Angelobacter sp.]|nr:hypothetical protein [Candidatus Angelobacter sp.]
MILAAGRTWVTQTRLHALVIHRSLGASLSCDLELAKSVALNSVSLIVDPEEFVPPRPRPKLFPDPTIS